MRRDSAAACMNGDWQDDAEEEVLASSGHGVLKQAANVFSILFRSAACGASDDSTDSERAVAEQHLQKQHQRPHERQL